MTRRLLFFIMLIGCFTLASLITTQAASTDANENWPQWRGPTSNGVALTANPPTTWNDTTNIKWKVKLPGKGSSTPIIWNNLIFLQTAIPTGKKPEPEVEKKPEEAKKADAPPPADGKKGGRRGGGFSMSRAPTEIHQFVLLCLDRPTGKTLWERVVREEFPHEGHHGDHGFASYSPVTDGKHVYASFGSRGVHCFDLDGNLKWQKDLGKMKTKATFGEGSSPALYGNTVVINWDHEGDDFIVALDKETGNELWRQNRQEDTTWSTPLIVQHDNKAQVVTAATKKIRSYDLASGELIWECAGLTPNAIPSPVSSDGVVYATSGFRGNALLAIRLGHKGDLTGTDAIAWSHKKSTPYVPSPLLYGDRIYFFGGNSGNLSCFDVKSGQAVFGPERIAGLSGVYASPVGAGGRIYLVGRNGTSVVIKHADKLEILATNVLKDRIDASPAAVGNELFLRGQEHLYCIAE